MATASLPHTEIIETEPYRLVIHGNEWGEPISEDAMRFRLIYTGDLCAHNQLRPKAQHKHDIRTKISPQLKRLWETNHALRRYGSLMGAKALSRSGESYPEGGLYSEENRLAGIEHMADLNKKMTTRFIPLVIPEFCLRCRIDVLLLRPEDTPQHILQSGDLDNRVKTLFDALRIPRNEDHEVIDDGGTHFVLLQNDDLISEISVIGDNLLMLPGKPKVGGNDSFVLIDVHLETTEKTAGEARFMF